jgi:uncharacterized protein YabE (DUF348 family)
MTDKRKVPIKIDGETFPLDTDTPLVADLLRLAGVDPDQYDLFQLTNDDSVALNDNDHITVSPGQKFVTKRHAAPVA